MPSSQPHGLTDPTAPRQEGGERLALARLHYPRRAMLCSPARGTELHLAVLPGQQLDLRVPRPLGRGSVLLLRLRESQTLLAHVTGAVRQADGLWRIRCQVAGAVEVPCAVQSA